MEQEGSKSFEKQRNILKSLVLHLWGFFSSNLEKAAHTFHCSGCLSEGTMVFWNKNSPRKITILSPRSSFSTQKIGAFRQRLRAGQYPRNSYDLSLMETKASQRQRSNSLFKHQLQNSSATELNKTMVVIVH